VLHDHGIGTRSTYLLRAGSSAFVMSGLAHRAARILDEEIRDDDPWPDETTTRQALAAVEELLDRPRATWPAPTSPWERLVVAIAVSTLRLMGGQSVGRRGALSHVAVALRNERPAFARRW
jgi:hypothetical protein